MTVDPLNPSQNSLFPVESGQVKKGEIPLELFLGSQESAKGKGLVKNIKEVTSQHSNVKEKATEVLGKAWNIEKILGLPKELRIMFLKGLSLYDLKAFETSLGHGRQIDDKLQPALQHLRQIIGEEIQAFLQKQLLEILNEHPSWKKGVMRWGNKVSLEDKVWLLQLYELNRLGLKIPELDAAHKKGFVVPSNESLLLLTQGTKKVIHDSLLKVTEFNVKYKGLKKCPQAIFLLVNLENLNLVGNKLTTPPDFKDLVNLKILNLGFNQLTEGPDISQNVRLEELNLTGNELTVAPDFSRNVNLNDINLSYNKLAVAPDFSANVRLDKVELSNNLLIFPPDFSRNINLQLLHLNNNKLKIPPNVSHNVKLWALYLHGNELTIAPDVSRNVILAKLFLSDNQLTDLPDISKNVKLKKLMIQDNNFNEQAKKQIEALQKQPDQNLSILD